MKTQIWDMTETSEHPPQLQELVGLRVARAWLVQARGSFPMLVVRIEGGFMFTVQRAKEIIATPGEVLLSIDVGTEKPGKDWSDLDFLCAPNKHIDELPGLPFTGIEGSIISFGRPGGRVGVKLELDRVIWVRRR